MLFFHFPSSAVNSALALVTQLEEDLRCTNTTQMEVKELQGTVATLITEAQADISQVRKMESIELEMRGKSLKGAVDPVQCSHIVGLYNKITANFLGLTAAKKQSVMRSPLSSLWEWPL
jgi:ribosomal protein L17